MSHPIRIPIFSGALDIFSSFEKATRVAEFRSKAWGREYIVKNYSEYLFIVVEAGA